MVSLMSCAPGVVIRNSVKIVLNLMIIRLASLSWAQAGTRLLVCNSAQASEEERDKTRRRGHSEISFVKNFYIIWKKQPCQIYKGFVFIIYLSDKL